MSMTMTEQRQEILALEPRLTEWAGALTRDANEAAALVRETLLAAAEPGAAPPIGLSTQAWLHGLLRRRFHSVERARDYRRSPSTALTELSQVHRRALATEADQRQ